METKQSCPEKTQCNKVQNSGKRGQKKKPLAEISTGTTTGGSSRNTKLQGLNLPVPEECINEHSTLSSTKKSTCKSDHCVGSDKGSCGKQDKRKSTKFSDTAEGNKHILKSADGGSRETNVLFGTDSSCVAPKSNFLSKKEDDGEIVSFSNLELSKSKKRRIRKKRLLESLGINIINSPKTDTEQSVLKKRKKKKTSCGTNILNKDSINKGVTVTETSSSSKVNDDPLNKNENSYYVIIDKKVPPNKYNDSLNFPSRIKAIDNIQNNKLPERLKETKSDKLVANTIFELNGTNSVLETGNAVKTCPENKDLQLKRPVKNLPDNNLNNIPLRHKDKKEEQGHSENVVNFLSHDNVEGLFRSALLNDISLSSRCSEKEVKNFFNTYGTFSERGRTQIAAVEKLLHSNSKDSEGIAGFSFEQEFNKEVCSDQNLKIPGIIESKDDLNTNLECSGKCACFSANNVDFPRSHCEDNLEPESSYRHSISGPDSIDFVRKRIQNEGDLRGPIYTSPNLENRLSSVANGQIINSAKRYFASRTDDLCDLKVEEKLGKSIESEFLHNDNIQVKTEVKEKLFPEVIYSKSKTNGIPSASRSTGECLAESQFADSHFIKEQIDTQTFQIINKEFLTKQNFDDQVYDHTDFISDIDHKIQETSRQINVPGDNNLESSLESGSCISSNFSEAEQVNYGSCNKNESLLNCMNDGERGQQTDGFTIPSVCSSVSSTSCSNIEFMPLIKDKVIMKSVQGKSTENPNAPKAEKSREEVLAAREAKRLAKLAKGKKGSAASNTSKPNTENIIVPNEQNVPSPNISKLEKPDLDLNKCESAHFKEAVKLNESTLVNAVQVTESGNVQVTSKTVGDVKLKVNKSKKGEEGKEIKSCASEVQNRTLFSKSKADETDNMKEASGDKLKGTDLVGDQQQLTAAVTAVKSKAELRAERRAKQEEQRARKATQQEEKVLQVKPGIKEVTKSKELIKGAENSVGKKIAKTSRQSMIVKAPEHRVKLFNHLYHERGPMAITENLMLRGPDLHPAIIKLGMQYADRIVVGSNARCIALLDALKQVIRDYETPPQKEFSRGLEAELQPSVTFLDSCRPHSVSMTNALRHLMWQLTQLPNSVSDSEAKKKLLEAIDTYIREQIEVAAQAISLMVRKKIANGDVILTYGCSSLLQHILLEAHQSGTKFRVVVVDGRPWREGQEMLRRLVEHGLDCSYVLVSAASFIMREVTKVFLGAHALLANGYVMSRAGSSQVALLAHSYNVPVLVCCETHKFCERVQTDSFVYNELGNPDDLVPLDSSSKEYPLSKWRNIGSLTPLNLTYDVTPPDLVTAVVTELAILPCTSVPVILRIKPTETGC